jgi:hypothetical protein
VRLSHRQALLLYALTVLAAVITMIGTGPAAHADGPGQGAPWVVSVGDSTTGDSSPSAAACARSGAPAARAAASTASHGCPWADELSAGTHPP